MSGKPGLVFRGELDLADAALTVATEGIIAKVFAPGKGSLVGLDKKSAVGALTICMGSLRYKSSIVKAF